MNNLIDEEIVRPRLGKTQTQGEGREKTMKDELYYIIHTG